MRFFIRILLACVALFSTATMAAQLDRAAVDAFCATSDAAVAKKDIDALGKLIAPNAKITLTIIADGQRQSQSMTKAEYLAAAREGLKGVTDYKHDRKTLSVEILSQGQKAIVKDKTIESMRMGGARVHGVSTSTFTIELVGGTPLLTALTGESKVNAQ